MSEVDDIVEPVGKKKEEVIYTPHVEVKITITDGGHQVTQSRHIDKKMLDLAVSQDHIIAEVSLEMYRNCKNKLSHV